MCRTLAYRASFISTSSTNYFKRLLGINFAECRNEFTARGIGAENPGFPWRTKLYNTFHKQALFFFIQDRFDCVSWYSLAATSGWHLRFFFAALNGQNSKAFFAIIVSTWKCTQRARILELFPATNTRAKESAFFFRLFVFENIYSHYLFPKCSRLTAEAGFD